MPAPLRLILYVLLLTGFGLAQSRKTPASPASPPPPTAAAANGGPSVEHHLKVYRQAKRYSDVAAATTALLNALVLEPANNALRDSLASLYFTSRQFLQTILVATEVLEAEPTNARMLELRAISYQSLGAAKDALENYEKLYQQSREVYHLYQVAVLQFQLQRMGECRQSLQQVLADPKATEEKVSISIGQTTVQEVILRAAALNVLGVLLLDQKEPAEARKMFEEALKAQPDFALPKGNLEAMDAKEKDDAKKGG